MALIANGKPRPLKVVENSGLLTRKVSLGSVYAPDHRIRVQQESQHVAVPYLPFAMSQRSERSASRISSGICTFSRQHPFQTASGEAFLAGPIVATGFPRFVTVTVVPLAFTSFRIARHLALNAVAVDDEIRHVFFNSE